MSAMNLKCVLCQSVFLSNPVQESDLNNYYTNNYLPYKGAAAWEIQVICYKKSTKFRFKRVKVVANNTKNKKIIFYSGCGLW
jgi:hypothetical protein